MADEKIWLWRFIPVTDSHSISLIKICTNKRIQNRVMKDVPLMGKGDQ